MQDYLRHGDNNLRIENPLVPPPGKTSVSGPSVLYASCPSVFRQNWNGLVDEQMVGDSAPVPKVPA